MIWCRIGFRKSIVPLNVFTTPPTVRPRTHYRVMTTRIIRSCRRDGKKLVLDGMQMLVVALPRDAMQARPMSSCGVCLSLCVYVCVRVCHVRAF